MLNDTCIEMEALMALPPNVPLMPGDRERLELHLAECAGCFASAAELTPQRSAEPAKPSSRAWIGAAVLVAAAAAVLFAMLARDDHYMEHEDRIYVRGPEPQHTPPPAAVPGSVTIPIKYGKTLKLYAVLEAIPAVPHCGTLMFVVTAKYRVLRVLSGHYPHGTLYVNHVCPELARPALRAGHTYTLTVERKRPKLVTSNPLDRFADKQLPRYWAHKVAGPPMPHVGPVPARTTYLTIVGRAVQTTQAGPDCGVLAMAQRVRYRVLRVIKGRYNRKHVDVTVPCARVPVGSIDRLELGPEPKGNNNGFSWTILGKLSGPARPSYWLRKRSPRRPPSPQAGHRQGRRHPGSN